MWSDGIVKGVAGLLWKQHYCNIKIKVSLQNGQIPVRIGTTTSCNIIHVNYVFKFVCLGFFCPLYLHQPKGFLLLLLFSYFTLSLFI